MFVQTVGLQAGDTGTVTLQAVSRCPENKEWAAYTPSGTVNLSLSNKATPALDWFKERSGREVFVDISDATEPIEE
jgi:hypothetical protein